MASDVPAGPMLCLYILESSRKASWKKHSCLARLGEITNLLFPTLVPPEKIRSVGGESGGESLSQSGLGATFWVGSCSTSLDRGNCNVSLGNAIEGSCQ